MKAFRFYELWAYTIAHKILMRGVRRNPAIVKLLHVLYGEWLKKAEALAMELVCEQSSTENFFPVDPYKGPCKCPACGSDAEKIIGWVHCGNAECYAYGPKFWFPPAAEPEKQDGHGCHDCKHDKVEANTYPCNSCIRANPKTADYWGAQP